ncbi:cation:proton antiporter [Actinomarinicola tropica]|uniref:Cation/H+ exchanger transmembrane domain-containing protein n=1 Tax=Actinomarinicola tropica TaxID=2789776 RepID=A0A5Q2RPH9_9ACTN|nr:cation:proton antiporter [Actinomarinicola tropica]QGG95780.1 hypothetical protein GH723_12110 [Actinomarinicola tropica]
MDELHLGYAVAGLIAVALILASARIERLPITSPMVGLVAGAVLGAPVLGWLTIDPDVAPTLLLESTRAILAVSLIGVALRFPVRELGRALRPVAALVGLGMPLIAAATAGLAAWTLGWPWELAALLGACLCPTDPILASGVVTTDAAISDLPERTRQVITIESGANDGLALPLVAVGIAAVAGDGLGGAATTAGVEVVLALVVGVPIGYVVGRLTRYVDEHGITERTPELMVTLFMAVGVLGIGRAVDADGILAVFVAGLAYNVAVPDREREQQEQLDEAFNEYLVIPVFIVIGTLLPTDAWTDLGAPLVAFVVGVLLVRRLPAVLALSPLSGLALPQSAFVGWFGPIGISAAFYLVHAHHEGVLDDRLFAAGMAAVAASTIIHGATQGIGRHLLTREDRAQRLETKA